MLLANIGMFDYNKNINHIYLITKSNLLPAMFFLMFLHIDFKHHTVGCACTIGTKRYWLIIILAIFVSFVSQLLANYWHPFSYIVSVIVFVILFGILGSFTRLKELNGISEIATTMLYIIIALIGSKSVI